jgi:hypothetical protein
MKVRQLLIGGFCLLAVNWSQQLQAMNAATSRNYRQLIADDALVKTIRDRLNLMSPLTVSELRPSVLTQPGEWNACIKVVSQGILPPKPESDLEDNSSDASKQRADKRPAVKKRPAVPMPLQQGPVTVGYYAIFFRNGEIAESRRAVLIDHCEQLQYSLLPKASKPKAGAKSDR